MDNDAPKPYQAEPGTRCLSGDDYPRWSFPNEFE